MALIPGVCGVQAGAGGWKSSSNWCDEKQIRIKLGWSRVWQTRTQIFLTTMASVWMR